MTLGLGKFFLLIVKLGFCFSLSDQTMALLSQTALKMLGSVEGTGTWLPIRLKPH